MVFAEAAAPGIGTVTDTAILIGTALILCSLLCLLFGTLGCDLLTVSQLICLIGKISFSLLSGLQLGLFLTSAAIFCDLLGAFSFFLFAQPFSARS